MKFSGIHPTESQLKDMVRSVDTDKNGTLNFSEFLTLMIREVMKPEMEKLRGIFRALDKNKDGTITVKEARQGLKESGYSMKEIDTRLEKLFKRADFDKDGKIKFEGYREPFPFQSYSVLFFNYRAPSQCIVHSSVTPWKENYHELTLLMSPCHIAS